MRSASLALLLCSTGPAAAQTISRPDSVGPTCWRGRPLPACASFLVTDFSYGKRLNQTPDAGGTFLTGELGGMVNTGRRTAWGGAVVKSVGADRSYLGFRPRYRRWLGEEASLDLSLGVLMSGDHDRFTPKFPSFTAHVALTQGDVVGVTLGAEVIRGGPRGADVGWYGGLRFGSYAAPAAATFMFLLLVLTWGEGT